MILQLTSPSLSIPSSDMFWGHMHQLVFALVMWQSLWHCCVAGLLTLWMGTDKRHETSA
jgi:hypothetical protein